MKLKSLLCGALLLTAASSYAQYNRNYYRPVKQAEAVSIFNSQADQTYTISICYQIAYPNATNYDALLTQYDNAGNIVNKKVLDNFVVYSGKILETDNSDLLIAMTGDGAMGKGLYIMRYDAALNDQWPQMLFYPTDDMSVVDMAVTDDWNNPGTENYLVLYGIRGADQAYPSDMNVSVLKIDGSGTTIYNVFHEVVGRAGYGTGGYNDAPNSLVRLPDDPRYTGHAYAIAGTNIVNDQNMSIFTDIIFDGPGIQSPSLAYTRYNSGNKCATPDLTFANGELGVSFAELVQPFSFIGLMKLRINPGSGSFPPNPSFSLVDQRRYAYYTNNGAANTPMAITSGGNRTYRISNYISDNLGAGDPMNANILYIDQATLNPMSFVRYNVKGWSYTSNTHCLYTSAADDNFLAVTKQAGPGNLYENLKVIRTTGGAPESTCGGEKDDIVMSGIRMNGFDVPYQLRQLPAPSNYTPSYSIPGLDFKDCNNSTDPARFRPAGPAPVVTAQPHVFPTILQGDATLHIRLPETAGSKGYTCSIFNVQGQLVYEKALAPGTAEQVLQPGLAAAGIYLLRIVSDSKETFTFRLAQQD